MFFRNSCLIACALILLPLGSHAYLYERKFYSIGHDYIRLLARTSDDRLSDLESHKKRICENRYHGILKDGLIDIRIALGYFDWTTGSSVYYDNRNYGYSPSMDLGAYSAMKAILTSSCRGNSQICGFRKDPSNPYLFTKNVRIRGQAYRARVQVHYSSYSEYLHTNTVSNRSLQQQRTEYAQKFFEDSLRSSDAVFYFGHSRNGGGPDFAPPVFVRGKNKLDYNGYYKPRKPGFTRLLNAMEGDRHTSILGLLSCDSRDHFLRRIRKVAPETGVISSTDVLTATEVWTAMIGGVDSLLRGQCQKSFYQSLRLTPGNQKYITMDGVFE